MSHLHHLDLRGGRGGGDGHYLLLAKRQIYGATAIKSGCVFVWKAIVTQLRQHTALTLLHPLLCLLQALPGESAATGTEDPASE